MIFNRIILKNIFIAFVFLGELLLLSSCSSVSSYHYHHKGDYAPDFNIDISAIHDAVPKAEPLSKYGNPKSYFVNGEKYYVLKSAAGYDQTGIASWYGMKFYKQRTSSGEPYNVASMTAASKVLPLPTYVSVTNLKNHKHIIVKVNDRGPFHVNRIIDLSYVAAAKLDVLPTGTALVEVKAIDPRHYTPETAETSYISPQACEEKISENSASQQPTIQNKNISHNPQIYLQIGAFHSEHNASELKEHIKKYTRYNIAIKSGEKNNLPIYRVQIGPIPDVDSTDNLQAILRASNLGKPITIIQ